MVPMCVCVGACVAPEKSVDASSLKTIWNGNSLNISWEPLTLHEARGFPVYYVYLSTSSGPVKREIEPVANTTDSSIVIDGLDSSQTYLAYIRVAANGGNTRSDTSEPGICALHVYVYTCVTNI